MQVQAAADSIVERMNAGLWPLWVPRRNQLIDEARQRLRADEFDAAVKSGEGSSFEEAAAESMVLLAKIVDKADQQTATRLVDGGPSDQAREGT
jgi:hypothetical protein